MGVLKASRAYLLNLNSELSSVFLRYAKHETKHGEAPPEHVLLPAFTATLDAAFQSEKVPKEDNGGLITLRHMLQGCPIDDSQ